jgi:hypothetical protein
MSRSSGGRGACSALPRAWGGAAIGKSQPHFPRLGHQPFHQGPQPLIFINQQLLAVQHRFQPLLKLALENSR